MSSNRRRYYLRIQVLLVDGGTMVLRKVFDEKKSHSPLVMCLTQNQGKFAYLLKRGVINIQQHALLTSSSPTLTSFDITLLSCLLRNVCGLKNSNDPIWSSLPAQSDLSIEADLVRFRSYRNEFAHINSTSALSENDFNTKWSDIEQVLLRLNSGIQNGVPNLKLELDKLKSEPLDEKANEQYQQQLKEWQDMDIALSRDTEIIASKINDLQVDVNNLSKDVTDIKKDTKSIAEHATSRSMISPEQKSLHDSSQMYFDDEKDKMQYYVKTNVYNEASKKLQTSGIAILCGHPGEGKTTMAGCLLIEMANESKLLRLGGPDDWRLVDSDAYTAVLIDDIFGNAVLDAYKVRKWEGYLKEICLAAKKKRLSFVITTRHYIMQEAKENLQRNDMFEKEHVIMLSSNRLDSQEKYKIIESHLKKNGKEIDANLLESVNMQWERVSMKVFTIGFPECAAMFASSEVLFDKGAKFFSSPLEFFSRCIHDISRNIDDFMALVFIWIKTQYKNKASGVSVSCNRMPLQSLEEDFDYPFESKSRVIKKCLERHRDEFLVFNTKTGEYSYSHSVISDVVGIVCAKDNAVAVIKHASKDFIMKYVKTSPSSNESFVVHIEEYQFPALIEKFYHMIYMEGDTSIYKHTGISWPFDDILHIKDDGIENTRMSKQFRMDISILKHDAFENNEFIKQFFKILWGKEECRERLKMPLLDAFEIFKSKYCIRFKCDDMGMTLPTLLLAKRKDKMVYECLKKKSLLNKNEACLSMLIAIRDKNMDLVKNLVSHGIKTSEDALQIALVNEDLEMLRFLLQHRDRSDSSSHIQNGNSVLITAAKRGSLQHAKCLLQGGVDLNYRNGSNVSALDKAVVWNNVEIVRLLLENGAKLNEKGGKFQRTPIHTAADMGHTDLVELLLNYGADVSTRDHRNDYPCQSAAVQGNADILKALLDKDISLGAMTLCHNGKNMSKGMSLYHIAIVQGNESVFRVLKEAGINANIKDKYGRTPLYLAVFHGKTRFVQVLIEVADPNLSEKNGYTPLHAAVHTGHIETVEMLCQHPRININQADKRGITPLHLACKTAMFEIIVELLKMPHIDVRMLTKKGMSVIHLLQNSVGECKSEATIENMRRCIEAIRRRDPYFVNRCIHDIKKMSIAALGTNPARDF